MWLARQKVCCSSAHSAKGPPSTVPMQHLPSASPTFIQPLLPVHFFYNRRLHSLLPIKPSVARSSSTPASISSATWTRLFFLLCRRKHAVENICPCTAIVIATGVAAPTEKAPPSIHQKFCPLLRNYYHWPLGYRAFASHLQISVCAMGLP